MLNPERIHIYLESAAMTGDDFSLVNLLVEDVDICLSSAVSIERRGLLQRVIPSPQLIDPTGIEREKLRQLHITSDRFSSIDSAEVMSGDATLELRQRISDSQCDLAILVRPTSLDLPHLLRELKCPTLVMRNPGPKLSRVVVAVQVEPGADQNFERYRCILGHADWLAKKCGAPLHVVQAWSLLGEEVLKSHETPEELQATKEKRKESIQREIDRLLSETRRRQVATVQLIEGDPKDVIVGVAQECDDQITVVGTVARTGIPGWIFGNFAERAVQTQASFLVVPASGI